MSKSSKKDATDDFFGKLIGEQNAVEPEAAIIGEDMFSAVTMWLTTGSSTLDTIISNDKIGGWPCGRVVEVFGREGIGKSTLAYAAMGHCQKMGGIPIFVDIEQAGAESIMRACGVDLKRLVYSRMTEMEKIFGALEKNLQSIIENPTYHGKPVVVVLDSLAAMSIVVETEGDYEHNMNANLRKAQQMGKALRKIVPFLNKANAVLIIVNQQRENPGITFGNNKYEPGGNAVKFAASVRLELRSAGEVVIMDPITQKEYRDAVLQWEEKVEQWKERGKAGAKPIKPKQGDFKGEKTIVGHDVEAFTKKNKVGLPKRTAKFRIMFGQGIVEEVAWFEYALKLGVIESAGKGIYKFTKIESKGIDTFGEEEWLSIMADVELRDKVRDVLIEKSIRHLDGPAAVSTPEESEDLE